jgi:glycosyltransferase involved in cell wall biosynthesis
MSGELFGYVLLAIICIAISPYYKAETPVYKKNTTVQTIPTTQVKTESPKTIVFLSDSFLPKTFAGSELSAYETLCYLRNRGHTILIFLKNQSVEKYDGFILYKYDLADEFCKTSIIESHYVFFQMGEDPKNLEIVKLRDKPVYIFIHLIDNYSWLLQQRFSFPLTVVYNSNTTQDLLPTVHDNMRMIPYVNTDKFKRLREITIQNDVVCLINCNLNKGGDLLIRLAKKMPDTQFIGVKGGYSHQVIDTNPPPNLTYIETQSDITTVFRKLGILIMPSKNETWGRTAVEAMAAGIPVIHSESPGLVECVGGAGISCSYNDDEAWEQAIRRISGDRAYRQQLRKYGFQRVEEIEEEQRRGRQEFAIKIEEEL